MKISMDKLRKISAQARAYRISKSSKNNSMPKLRTIIIIAVVAFVAHKLGLIQKATTWIKDKTQKTN